MKPFFKDAELQKQYERDGYVIVDAMLSKENIDKLAAMFKAIEPAGLNQMYVNMFDRTDEENIAIGNAIVEACTPKAQSLFINSRLDMGVFLAKGVGQQGTCIMHQDWNSVDEDNYESLSIWSPLVDLDEASGCLYVIKGSHRMFKTVRTITLKGLALDFDAEIEPYLTPLPIKAGQAVIYSHNLFHGSKATNSDKVRIAIGAGVFQNDSKILHYYKDEHVPTLMEVFETPPNFYLKNISKYFDLKRPNDLVKVGELHRDKFSLSRDDFFAALRNRALN